MDYFIHALFLPLSFVIHRDYDIDMILLSEMCQENIKKEETTANEEKLLDKDGNMLRKM